MENKKDTTINSNKYHSFSEQIKNEKQLRKPLDRLYKIIGTTEFVTDKQEQLSEVDLYIIRGNKKFGIEEKIQTRKFNFPTEMLLEHSHTFLDGTFRSYGWSQQDMKANLLCEFCVETGEFFLYKSKDLVSNAQELCRDLNNIPTGSYIRTVQNKYMTTTIVIMPRKHIENCLFLKGKIIKNSVIIDDV